ncbi:hypothetical protein CBS101457_006061 [Exobasidium rhododendri]|nr:hypothetical protein CBS101457_006061 [Exobasidium rhododendri]
MNRNRLPYHSQDHVEAYDADLNATNPLEHHSLRDHIPNQGLHQASKADSGTPVSMSRNSGAPLQAQGGQLQLTQYDPSRQQANLQSSRDANVLPFPAGTGLRLHAGNFLQSLPKDIQRQFEVSFVSNARHAQRIETLWRTGKINKELLEEMSSGDDPKDKKMGLYFRTLLSTGYDRLFQPDVRPETRKYVMDNFYPRIYHEQFAEYVQGRASNASEQEDHIAPTTSKGKEKVGRERKSRDGSMPFQSWQDLSSELQISSPAHLAFPSDDDQQKRRPERRLPMSRHEAESGSESGRSAHSRSRYVASKHPQRGAASEASHDAEERQDELPPSIQRLVIPTMTSAKVAMKLWKNLDKYPLGMNESDFKERFFHLTRRKNDEMDEIVRDLDAETATLLKEHYVTRKYHGELIRLLGGGTQSVTSAAPNTLQHNGEELRALYIDNTKKKTKSPSLRRKGKATAFDPTSVD